MKCGYFLTGRYVNRKRVSASHNVSSTQDTFIMSSPITSPWRLVPLRRSSNARNLLLLLLVQAAMMLYVIIPYYVTPYIHSTVDYASAPHYSVRLPRATSLSAVPAALPWLSAPTLPRVLTRQEHDACIALVADVAKLLEEFNITYVLFYGSLVGSYVMHDVIPWDDDVDIIVNINHFDRFERMMASDKTEERGIASHIHDNLLTRTFKLFWQNGRSAGSMPWTWPFIDVAFYGENETHVWNRNIERTWHLVVPKDWFYPLQLRPFSYLWLPAPRHAGKILKQHYKQFTCKRFAWNHKDEAPWWSTAYAPCDSLQPYYPFVVREPCADGVLETVVIGGRKVYSVVVQEDFNGATFLF